MTQLRIGIIGSGMIAGVIAKAIQQTDSAIVAGVASRRLDSATAFANEYGIATVFQSTNEMLASNTVDAVYIATPTSVKEEIAIAAATAKKHLLIDKPFASLASLQNIIDAAQKNAVTFMDATHFSHHQRTKLLCSGKLKEEIGEPHTVRTSFFFPFQDKTNIRFNPEKEPSGAVGDMAWYSMRAIVEYLKPTTPLSQIGGAVVKDKTTEAIVGGSGHIAYEDGKSSTFNFGYHAGVCVMDLDVMGPQGMIRLDDFVLDWKDGFAFDNPAHKVGYTKRSQMQTPDEWQYLTVPADKAQATLMIEDFVHQANDSANTALEQSIELAIQTQSLLDQYWNTVK